MAKLFSVALILLAIFLANVAAKTMSPASESESTVEAQNAVSSLESDLSTNL